LSESSASLTGELDFRELIDQMDLCLVALSPDWDIQYLNESSKTIFQNDDPRGELFWDALIPELKECLESAYKKALLGDFNQLSVHESKPRQQVSEIEIYDEMPLDMIEQKSVSFKFTCHGNGQSYSATFDLHHGHLLFRIEDITSLVTAQKQAEKNKRELEEALDRMKEARNAQPLTGLPGNIRIQEEMKERLANDVTFALVYADLDHFKPFNDRYGFERGNEVLLFLRDILEKSLEENPSELNFLGHVGGDDFVMMTDVDHYDALCQRIIERFDEEIPSFYDRGDRESGGIVTKNRQGEEQEFQFMTISLAVVTNEERNFENYLEMSEVAANVKKLAKKDRNTSCYRVDRRTDDSASPESN
jgi:diguanylate cyclase (GGDEF)-like protein